MRVCACRIGLAAVLAGCAITPDYERPELDVPSQYLEPAPPGESIANLDWWELLHAPQLQELIRAALSENKDLGVALARIAEARNLLSVVRAEQFPFIDLFGGASRGKPSQISVPGAGTRDSFAASADLSFELDLWGKLARATEAAQAELLATEAAYRNVTISLVANLANAYLLLHDLDERLAISQRTVAGRRDSLAIIQARFDKGTVAELAVNQAQIELAVARAPRAARPNPRSDRPRSAAGAAAAPARDPYRAALGAASAAARRGRGRGAADRRDRPGRCGRGAALSLDQSDRQPGCGQRRALRPEYRRRRDLEHRWKPVLAVLQLGTAQGPGRSTTRQSRAGGP